MKLALAALLLVSPSPSFAQAAPPSPSPARVAAQRRLDFLEGEWSGEGWMQAGPRRTTFTSREIVTREAGGLALLVKGRHLAGERVVHDALGVLAANDDGTYTFSSWLANGLSGAHAGEWQDGAFVWRMDTPAGRVRYTIRLDAQGRWHEVGERLGEGGASPFFEMTLSRSR
ncbi:MAG: hypothetical protein U0599_16715 [Vicinamibacteria bacterium]